MKAVDTNVLARFFVDDPDDAQAVRQRPAAVAALSQPVFVPLTVLLEFEWVLRGFYKLPQRQVARVLRALAGIEHVSLDRRDVVLAALDAFESAGLELADALHLASSSRCQGLMTFDRRMAKRAAVLVSMTPVELMASS